MVIALFTADAIPGLTLGCVIANLANMVISGTGDDLPGYHRERPRQISRNQVAP